LPEKDIAIPRLSDRVEQRQEVARFVRELYARSGCATWDRFAKRASVHAVQVSDWQRGRSVPDGYNLLKLIRASGLLEPDEDQHVIATVDRFIDEIAASPALVESYEPDLRLMTDEIVALATAASATADRLADLLGTRSPAAVGEVAD